MEKKTLISQSMSPFAKALIYAAVAAVVPFASISVAHAVPQCNDGIDNDSDGLIDLSGPVTSTSQSQTVTSKTKVPANYITVDGKNSKMSLTEITGTMKYGFSSRTKFNCAVGYKNGTANVTAVFKDAQDKVLWQSLIHNFSQPVDVPANVVKVGFYFPDSHYYDNSGSCTFKANINTTNPAKKDPNCTSLSDNTEGKSQCSDGLDNDGDGYADRQDQACWESPMCPSNCGSLANCTCGTHYNPEQDDESIKNSYVDSDSDGTPNFADECPNNPAKTSAGICGCAIADVDANNNGKIDCVEPPPVVVITPPEPPKYCSLKLAQGSCSSVLSKNKGYKTCKVRATAFAQLTDGIPFAKAKYTIERSLDGQNWKKVTSGKMTSKGKKTGITLKQNLPTSYRLKVPGNACTSSAVQVGISYVTK